MSKRTARLARRLKWAGVVCLLVPMVLCLCLGDVVGAASWSAAATVAVIFG